MSALFRELIMKESIGLHRDDGLAAINNKPPKAAKYIRKQLCVRFKKFGLIIAASANLTVIDFLDITLGLQHNIPSTRNQVILSHMHTYYQVTAF